MFWEDDEWDLYRWEEVVGEWGYWLSWSDGVIQEDPEPGEDELTEAKENPAFLDDWMAGGEEDAEEWPEVVSWPSVRSLVAILASLEGQAGRFEEAGVRVGLYLCLYVLEWCVSEHQLQLDEALLEGVVQREGERQKVYFSVRTFRQRLLSLLELYELDFPSQAYHELKRLRQELEAPHWEESSHLKDFSLLLGVLLAAAAEELARDPDAKLPPWEAERLRARLEVRKQQLQADLRARGLGSPAMLRGVQDLYQLLALEVLLRFLHA